MINFYCIWDDTSYSIFYSKSFDIFLICMYVYMKIPSMRKIWFYMIWWALATIIDMLFLYIFTDVCWILYLSSQVLSFCISLIFGFLFQKYITFQKNTWNSVKQLLLFFLFQLVGLWINLLVLKIAVETFNVYYMIGALFAKGIVFCRNFLINNFFNFKE